MGEKMVMTDRKQTTFTNALSEEIFNLTYKYGNETITDRLYKVAETMASVEEDKEFWTNEFFDLLTDFKFVPGGRILSNAGTDYKGTTFINCFVSGFVGEDQDSMEGILSELRRQALILKSEGGYGFCADVLRPRGGYIVGIGSESPGAVSMLEMWDTQSKVITEGSNKKSKNKNVKGKIRKGAMMATMSVWHADIEEFITAKQTPGRLPRFNMSVLISDAFMHAVKNNLEWNLIFPDYEYDDNVKEKYKRLWNGDIDKWINEGLPVKIYKTYKNANELWDLITSSTYNRNEPGVLFVDTINRLNNLYYCEHLSATNPCAEQILPIGGVCLLGSLNLTQFINSKNDNWDYNKLEKYISPAIRFMDNINDITNLPLEEQYDEIKNKRRIGLGIMGYGSSLFILKKKYGSKSALKLTDELLSFIRNKAYQASALLAKEKGTFPAYNATKYLNGEYIKTLLPETLSLISENGIRNSHLMSIQPNGNSSILCNCVSGGLEPVFLSEYIRTSTVPLFPNGLMIPINIDWDNKKYNIVGDTNAHANWRWIKEGDESMLSTIFNDVTYKIDRNRGLVKETLVIDYGVRYLKEHDQYDINADYIVCTDALTINDHINTMGVFSQHICSSMSKTVNIPADYPYEDFKDVYIKAYDTHTIKGVTTYRVGTMANVLAAKKATSESDSIVDIRKERNGHIVRCQAPLRPKSVPCDIHHLTVGGQRWTVFIGLVQDETNQLSPYEVFAFKKKNISLPDKVTRGTLTKMKRGRYDFETADGLTLEDISSLFDTDEQQSVTRLISLGLRHGANIKFIVEQLNKSTGDFTDFAKAIGRVIKRYIVDGEVSTDKCPNCSNTLVYSEGCVKCNHCDFSACG